MSSTMSPAHALTAPVVRPDVASVRRLLDEKGEFSRWRIGQVAERDNAPVNATVRVTRSASAAPGEPTSLQIGRNLGWLEDVRRFLVANGYAVRYTENRIALLLIDPWVEAVVDGKAVLRDQPAPVPASDRSLDQVPLPVPADHRWMRMFWEEWYAGLNGIGSAEDVRDAITHSAQQEVPAVVGGDGSIWFGATLYSPEHTAPPVKWEHYAVPAEFARTYAWNSTVREDCALALLPHRGLFTEEFYETAGAEPSRSRRVEWSAAVAAVETALEMPQCRVESNGRGAVRVWHRGGGLMVRTPVPGTESAAVPGTRFLDAHSAAVQEAARDLAAAGFTGAACGDRGPESGQGFYLEPADGEGAVRIVLAADGRIIGLPNSEVLTAWRVALEDAWQVTQQYDRLVAVRLATGRQ
ncbi:hypothetical protein ABT095_15075 [Kitasatospora sp. NPDC002227]|uniref:hypothetical protein n=1 Tax=Kitasatospora sp. NPDC002227 TaxID=3154773 RepID=UPI003325E0D7